MKTLIGGGAAVVLGIIGLAFWYEPFLQLLAGSIPAMLLLGGGLAVYLGFDELKDTWKKEEPAFEASSEPEPVENVDKYKQEIDDLKKEIEELKSDKA